MRTIITIFWILDILNLPFMEMFDTTYPLNTGFWILVMLFTGNSVTHRHYYEDNKY